MTPSPLSQLAQQLIAELNKFEPTVRNALSTKPPKSSDDLKSELARKGLQALKDKMDHEPLSSEIMIAVPSQPYVLETDFLRLDITIPQPNQVSYILFANLIEDDVVQKILVFQGTVSLEQETLSS